MLVWLYDVHVRPATLPRPSLCGVDFHALSGTQAREERERETTGRAFLGNLAENTEYTYDRLLRHVECMYRDHYEWWMRAMRILSTLCGNYCRFPERNRIEARYNAE